MKTLHIFHRSNLKNGVDKTTCTLIVALKKLGVTPIAVVPEEGDVTEYLNNHNILYRLIPYSCCAGITKRAQLNFLAESIGQTDLVVTFIQNESPDIIHINTGHLLHAGLAAAQCKIPAIWHIHSPFQEDLQRYKTTIGQGGYIWLLERLNSQIIGVSNDINQSLTEYLPSNRIKTLYNGVDIEELTQSAYSSSTDIRKELGIPSNAELIIGVGRISAQKDFAGFARVAGLVAKAKTNTFFIIAGPKKELEAVRLLENEISRLNLSDRLFILGSRGDIPSLVSQSNVFLSTAIFEGQGIAALEAMSLEKPVVAMACLGLRECINHEHDGLLVAPFDDDGAAKAIIRLLDHSHFAAELGANGKQSVAAKFSSAEYARQFLDLAEAAIQEGPGSISDNELEMLQGLLKQINIAHIRMLSFEQRTIKQRIKLILWELLNKLKAW